MNNKYNADSIVVFEGLEAVRKKIGMYAGTHSAGLHQCIYELLSNSNDEAMNGFGNTIELYFNDDNSVLIRDYGRGIPYEVHPKYNESTLTILFTRLHAGGKMTSSDEYKNTGGTHGVGIKIATASAEELRVKVWRGDGKIATQSFSKGIPTSGVVVEETKDVNTGTEIYYRPEFDIFGTDVHFELPKLKMMCRDFAYLTKGVRYIFHDNVSKKKEEYLYKDGLLDMYKDTVPKHDTIMKNPIYLETDLSEDNKIELVFGYTNTSSETIKSFCNALRLVEGGTHVTGFRTALTKAINDAARENGSLKPKDNNITGGELRDGLVAIMSLKVRKPLFENQTKTKLSNQDITYQVANVLGEYLKIWMQDNPREAQAIIDKVLQTRRIREAQKRTRDAILGVKKSTGLRDGLISKLADCSGKNPVENEIYLTEGDSASGGLKQARDPMTQAIMALKGKIKNIWSIQDDVKLLSSEVIRDIAKSLGCGVQDDFDIKKLRYHKVIIAADADCDGGHIQVLIMTMLYKLMPQLIEDGYVYLLVPPLFKVSTPKESYYFDTKKEMEEGIKSLKLKNYTVSRFKGLGEMKVTDIEKTIMVPHKRILKRLRIEDTQYLLRVLDTCAGDDSSLRKDFLTSGGEIQ